MSTLAAHVERGAGPPLVLLHGVGGNKACWPWQLAGLSDRWRVIAWDAPGYGDSPPLDRMTWPAIADALCGLLDGLLIDRAHLVGHSFGGMVAQAFAARH